MKIGLIVEGHGDVLALPVLLRRLAAERGQMALEIPPPIRLAKGKMRKSHELSRAIELIARKTAPDGALMLVVDADDDCPVSLAQELAACFRSTQGHRTFSVVVAVREFESWFIAGTSGLRGYRGWPEQSGGDASPEAVRDAKGWVNARIESGYHETADQPKLAQRFDLREARAARSFQKLCDDFDRLAIGQL